MSAGVVPFKPSQVDLSASFPPLTATMGRSEREAAASLIVFTLQKTGDAWVPVEPQAIGLAMKAALDAGEEPWKSIARNQSFRPDVFDLVDKGFARWTGEPGRAVELTDKGIEALRRWVRS